MAMVPDTGPQCTLRSSCCVCWACERHQPLSQAYGMMGWRCGYIAFPTPEAGAPADLGAQLTKVQDTIPICASQVLAHPTLRACALRVCWSLTSTLQLLGQCDMPLRVLCAYTEHSCCSTCHQAGQLVALRALQEGRGWVTDRVQQLHGNRCWGSLQSSWL
jgi:hypothetical protein